MPRYLVLYSNGRRPSCEYSLAAARRLADMEVWVVDGDGHHLGYSSEERAERDAEEGAYADVVVRPADALDLSDVPSSWRVAIEQCD